MTALPELRTLGLGPVVVLVGIFVRIVPGGLGVVLVLFRHILADQRRIVRAAAEAVVQAADGIGQDVDPPLLPCVCLLYTSPSPRD